MASRAAPALAVLLALAVAVLPGAPGAASVLLLRSVNDIADQKVDFARARQVLGQSAFEALQEDVRESRCVSASAKAGSSRADANRSGTLATASAGQRGPSKCADLCHGAQGCLSVCEEAQGMLCGVSPGPSVSASIAQSASAAASAATASVHDMIVNAIRATTDEAKQAAADAKAAVKEATQETEEVATRAAKAAARGAANAASKAAVEEASANVHIVASTAARAAVAHQIGFKPKDLAGAAAAPSPGSAPAS